METGMIPKSSTFQYWDTILHLEILGLIFVRAHSERDFALYINTHKTRNIRTMPGGVLFVSGI